MLPQTIIKAKNLAQHIVFYSSALNFLPETATTHCHLLERFNRERLNCLIDFF